MSNPPIVVNLDDDEVQIISPPPIQQRQHPVVLAPLLPNPHQYLLNRAPQVPPPMVFNGPYGSNIGSYAVNSLIQNNLPRYSFATISFSLISSKEFTARAEGLIGKEVLIIFKHIPGARFEYAGHRWVFPLDAHEILQIALYQNRHTVEPLPRSIITAAQLKNQRENSTSEDALYALVGTVPDKVLHSLAPFQREAVQFIIKNNGRALLADEMGLGKTRTAIAAATAYRDDWPVLIVCPSSARHHWAAELTSILHPDIVEAREITIIESASQPLTTGQRNFTYKFVIMSYNLIVKLAEQLRAFNFNVVIADECHYLKSRVAQRTLCLVPILQTVKRAMLLSGTPALSRPIELFPQLHALAPAQWPDVKSYGKRYCRHIKRIGTGINKTNKSWQEFGGASNTSELHLMLTSSLMIRRLKEDILSQLPKKKRVIERIGVKDVNKREELRQMLEEIREQEKIMSNKKRKKASGGGKNKSASNSAVDTGEGQDYEQRYVDIENIPDGGSNAPPYTSNATSTTTGTLHSSLSTEELAEVKKKHKVQLMELFNQSGIAKLPDVLKHLGIFLDNKMSGKVLVFAHHRNVLDGVTKFLKARGEVFIRIDGQTTGKDRHSRVEYFQNSVCRVAVLAITAAGIAITLTSASTVMFAEVFWTPGSLIQAEDRAHRIGQTSEVQVKYFLADDTVDELLWPLVRKKMRLLGEFVEGQMNNDMTATSSSSSSNSSSNSSCGEESTKGGKRDWLTEKLIEDSSASAMAKKRSFGDIKDTDSVLLDDLEDLVKELVKDDSEMVTNADDGDSDDDSGDNNNSNAGQAVGGSNSSSSGGLVKSESSGTVENEDDLDVSAELPDYLAELYMSEQLAVNNMPWSVLAQQQIVHRFDGSGRFTVMTAKDVEEMLSRSKSKKSGEVEVVDLEDDDEADTIKVEPNYGGVSSSSSGNGGGGARGRKGYAFSGKCDDVIDLFSDDVTSIATDEGVFDLADDEEKKNAVEESSVAVPPVLTSVGGVTAVVLASTPPVVRNDYSNMLTGGLGTVQKASIYSSGASSGRFIPAVIPSSGSNNSLGGLVTASRPSLSPGISSSAAGTTGMIGVGPAGTTPRQFVPKPKSASKAVEPVIAVEDQND